MKYYHITRQKHLESIKNMGIIPGFRVGITCGRCPKHKVVFLTDAPKYILESQCGAKWCEKHKPIIIEIDVRGLSIKAMGNTEYTTPEKIPADKFLSYKSIEIKREGSFSKVVFE